MTETKKKAGMHVGVQGMETSKVDLQFLTRHGVTHMNGGVEDYEVEILVRHREEAAAEGVSFEATHIGLDRSITLAIDPERDRAIDELCQSIENAGRAGIRALFYNFCILDHVHFRNIRGGLHNFQEVWPDEGDVDMYKLAQIFRDVEYPYMLMPDHAPGHPDDARHPEGSFRVGQAWAFQFGYIIALIETVHSRSSG